MTLCANPIVTFQNRPFVLILTYHIAPLFDSAQHQMADEVLFHLPSYTNMVVLKHAPPLSSCTLSSHVRKLDNYNNILEASHKLHEPRNLYLLYTPCQSFCKDLIWDWIREINIDEHFRICTVIEAQCEWINFKRKTHSPCNVENIFLLAIFKRKIMKFNPDLIHGNFEV